MQFITSEPELKFGESISAMYFYANWLLCHKKMLLMIGKVEDSYKDLTMLAVDVDHFKGLCRRYNVESIPTVILVNNDGKELKRINGISLTSAFRKVFADIYKAHGDTNAKKKSSQI